MCRRVWSVTQRLCVKCMVWRLRIERRGDLCVFIRCDNYTSHDFSQLFSFAPRLLTVYTSTVVYYLLSSESDLPSLSLCSLFSNCVLSARARRPPSLSTCKPSRPPYAPCETLVTKQRREGSAPPPSARSPSVVKVSSRTGHELRRRLTHARSAIIAGQSPSRCEWRCPAGRASCRDWCRRASREG